MMEKGEEDRLRGIAMCMLGYNNLESFNSGTQDLGTLVSDAIRVSRFREGVVPGRREVGHVFLNKQSRLERPPLRCAIPGRPSRLQ